jgi:cold shock CspA family protein
VIEKNPNTILTLEQYNFLEENIELISGTTIEEANFKKENIGQILDLDRTQQISGTKPKRISKEDLSSLPKSDSDVNRYISNTQSWIIGRVKTFNYDKGYGFIECWDDKKDYFFHISKVESSPVGAGDFIVFKLMPSRKKPGTDEAVDVYLVSEFGEDYDYLIEQYFKRQDELLKDDILKALPAKEKLQLLESVLVPFTRIEDDSTFLKFKLNIRLFSTMSEPVELKTKITEKISGWLTQVANPKYYIQLWADGTFQVDPPTDSLIEDFFIKSSNQERLVFFNLLDYEHKIKLLKQLNSIEEPKTILEFVLDHLKQLNKISSHIDVKLKLYENEYWSDKKGHELFLNTIENLKNNIDERSKLELYFAGYLNSFSIDYVLLNNGNLSNEEIEQLLKSGLFSQKDVLSMMSIRLESEINKLPVDFKGDFSEQEGELEKSEWSEYGENHAKPFYWIFDILEKHLTKSYIKKKDKIIEKIPKWLQFLLWNHGFTGMIPAEYIANHLLTDDRFQEKIDYWLAENKITIDKASQILQSNIQKIESISSRKHLYLLYNHCKALINLDFKLSEIENLLELENQWFFKLICWLEGLSSEFNFDEFKTKLVFLLPEHQVKFVRKLFWLKQTNEFDLTVDKLNQLVRIDFDIFKLNAEVNTDVHLDISVDIVIEAIKSFSEKGKFLFDSQLLTLVLGNITNDKKFRFKISELFEDCKGRCGLEYDWRRNGEVRKEYYGNNQYYYAIQFNTGEEKFEEIKEKVKALPGRKWNTDRQHWGVPSNYEEQVLQFARENRFFIHGEGGNAENNIHLAELKLKDIPNGIQFCEGRLANVENRLFKREFWWCCNQPCFSHCETMHNPEDWEQYTFLDFLTIMGFDLDDGNRVGDYIEKGKYYQFISTINQFNRLLERMYCDSCNHILYPIEDSHFAYHRVVRFHCENAECEEYHIEIYLNHCLNGRCNGIIDSRRSKKCPNGLYICSDKTCGCCCSHEMMRRRLQNLRTTGGFIHQNLINDVENEVGHLERAEHFCYKCGRLMEELPDDVFHCNDCNISYDVSKNNFQRPHRHLGKTKTSTLTEEPPPEPEDFHPF